MIKLITILIGMISASFGKAGETPEAGGHTRMIIPDVIQRISESSDDRLKRSELTRRLTSILQSPDPRILIRVKQEGDGSSERWYAMNLKTKEILDRGKPRDKKAFITLVLPHFGAEFTAVSKGLQMKFQTGPAIKLLSVTKNEPKSEQDGAHRPATRRESKSE